MNSESLTIGIVSPSSIYLLGGGAFGRVCLRILISRACLRTLPGLFLSNVVGKVVITLQTTAPLTLYLRKGTSS